MLNGLTATQVNALVEIERGGGKAIIDPTISGDRMIGIDFDGMQPPLLERIDEFSNLETLESLFLSHSQIKNVEPLEGLTQLQNV